jgi:hypothetical protein
MRNDLQRAISKSFSTSKRKVDPFVDENEQYHEATTTDALPWCKDMQELADVMDITKAHLYKLLKNPPDNFPMQYVRVLHRQLHSKFVHGFFTDHEKVPLAETIALIRWSREQVDQHEADEQARDNAKLIAKESEDSRRTLLNRERLGRATRALEADAEKVEAATKALSGGSLREYVEQMSTTAKTLQQFNDRMKKQDQMIDRLMALAEKQQELIDKLSESEGKKSA